MRKIIADEVVLRLIPWLIQSGVFFSEPDAQGRVNELCSPFGRISFCSPTLAPLRRHSGGESERLALAGSRSSFSRREVASR